MRTGTRDPALTAHILDRAPLYFAGGADALSDRAAHVRAGSGLACVPGALALVQDDSNFIALVDPALPREVRAIALPRGAGGRRQFGERSGNKHHKLDLEACFTADDGDTLLFVALGSGATPARENVVLVTGWESGTLATTMVAAPQLYERLRAEPAFAGSQLNVEGALLIGQTLRLFGRGNGAPRDDLVPVNATCDLAWPELLDRLRRPEASAASSPANVVRYELGALDGVPLGFTDVAAWREHVLFTAAAERSPDVIRDGVVSGSAIGIIDSSGDVRWTPIVSEEGSPVREKAEGLLVADAARPELWVVADVDDETRPSELWRVRLAGPWAG